MTDYQINEIETAEKNHDWNFDLIIQFKGTKNDSRNFNITKEQLKKIKDVLKD